jgi:hypothetical protein
VVDNDRVSAVEQCQPRPRLDGRGGGQVAAPHHEHGLVITDNAEAQPVGHAPLALTQSNGHTVADGGLGLPFSTVTV